MKSRTAVFVLMGIMALILPSFANGVTLNSYFTDNMVLQRDKVVKVWGTGEAGTEVSVTFSGQKITGKVGSEGLWMASLQPMQASAKPQEISVSSGAGKPLVVRNVLVGDVWFVGRQSYVDISLGSKKAGQASASQYIKNDLFRAISIKTVPASEPQTSLSGNATTGWVTVDQKNALDMTGSSFYLGRDLVEELGVPVGIVDVNMNHHFALSWLSEQGIADSQTMHDSGDINWLTESMPKKLVEHDSGEAQKKVDQWNKARGDNRLVELYPLKNPIYPSCGYNAVISPLKNITVKGVLLQLGNDYPFVAYREMEKRGLLATPAGYGRAWYDNYFIIKLGFRITPNTLPYITRDWRQSFGDKELPFGLILPPASDLDVYAVHNREIRELQRRTAEKGENIGIIFPGMKNIPLSGQPEDDKLLAQRCKAWVLSQASGPLFDRVVGKGKEVTLQFKTGTAKGLKSSGSGLKFFEAAGRDGVFSPAEAEIEGETIKVTSENAIYAVRYNWVEKPNQELINEAGLPAIPFSSDADWTFAWIPPPAEQNLPAEYSTTADKWSKSNVAIINGQIANMAAGDSEPIPVRPGPLGLVAAPFGPNIYVKSTEANSPAKGKLFPGDLIYGVAGKKFDDSPAWTVDDMYLALADAITQAETEEGQGKLLFSVRRGSELMEVELQLEVMGSFSSTSPIDCEKSEKIVENAEEWISKRFRPTDGLSPAWGHGSRWRSGPQHPSGMLGSDLLFLMASGNPKHQGLVRRAIYRKIKERPPEPVLDDTVSYKPWGAGHNAMVAGEYFHATGDRNVLPYLKLMADLASASQLKPRKDTPASKEAAYSEEQVGGWRHNYPGNPERWKSGYGLLPHAGMGCVMGMQFGKEAGINIDDLALQRGLEHHYRGRAQYGYVLYSYNNLRKTAPPPLNPEAEAKGNLWSMNGKLGMAAALYSMVEGYDDAVDQSGRICVYGYNRTRSGHGGMFFNNFWTPIGAWAMGEGPYKHFMKGQRWWRELFRRSDGSFNQAGRGGIGVSYAIHRVAHKKRLRMLGAPSSAFGMNCPAGLKPAITAHRERNYKLCEDLIVKYLEETILSPEERPLVDHLLTSVQILRASIEHDLGLVENQLKKGQYFHASLELDQLKGVVSHDNPRLKEIVAVLESENAKQLIDKSFSESRDLSQKKALAYMEENPQPSAEKWVKVIPEKTGKWQLKLVEGISNAPEDWTLPDFDDSNWIESTTPISWTMYHTALFRGKFNIDDPSAIEGVRVVGKFFRQANVVVHLNGKLVAKIDELGRGTGSNLARLTEYGVKQLKKGENTVTVSTRHLRRWGPARGPSAATVSITLETMAK